MKRTPSVKALREVFQHNARAAKKILRMSRAELLQTDAGAARYRECFNPPATWDLRMHALNALDSGLFGIEHCETEHTREFASYLNAGDTYNPTVIYWRGRYRVQCLGDFIERAHVKFR